MLGSPDGHDAFLGEGHTDDPVHKDTIGPTFTRQIGVFHKADRCTVLCLGRHGGSCETAGKP